jgi:copper transport protein
MRGTDHMIRPRSVMATLVGLVAVVLLLGPGSASAHNSLETSSPADGAVVDAGIDRWVLTFTKDVPTSTASAEIIGADGVRTKLAEPTNGASPREIVFVLPAGLSGEVTARWKLIGTDGHVVSARVRFTVEAAASAATVPGTSPSASPVTTEPVVPAAVADEETYTPSAVRWLVRLTGYAGLVMLGGLVVMAMTAPGGLGAGLATRRAGTFMTGAGGVVAASSLLQLLIFLDDVTGRGVVGSLGSLGTAFDTTAGSMLFMRLLAAVVLVVGLVRAQDDLVRSVRSVPVVALLLVQLVTHAYLGHSRSMAWPVLGVPVDVVHTAASLAWLGGLVVVTFLVAPALDPRGIVEAYERFGTVAQRAVIVILVTGFVQTARLHPSVFTLLTQSHGRWLEVKLLLVAAMLKIGDINRRRLLRAIPVDGNAMVLRSRLLRRASTTEAVTGGLVMAVTAVLVSSSFD